MKGLRRLSSYGGMENLMTKTELIIFDLDGTLVDSETVYQKGWVMKWRTPNHILRFIIKS